MRLAAMPKAQYSTNLREHKVLLSYAKPPDKLEGRLSPSDREQKAYALSTFANRVSQIDLQGR